MSGSPLYLAFLWHMHQPYYRDPFSGIYRLPWVRLHGTKDYLDMLEILKDFPAIRQNFNLVPSLLEQLVDYAEHGGSDVFLELTKKPASDLNEKERVFLLENFFLAHWDNMIRPFPRYHELLIKRGTHVSKKDLARTARYFSDQDLRDLQVLFNLCWIDPLLRQEDDLLKALAEKGERYSEEDKALIIEKQMGILRRIIPAYREMAMRGQVELSFTPFYHPILPLLCDTDIARVAMPQVALPRRRFSHPGDAERQIASGMEYFQEVFGLRPAGMWPSEGSVSEQVLRMAAKQGVSWVASDEGVLSNSLHRPLRDSSGTLTAASTLYQPYAFGDVSIVFRDHTLSDLIGFVYSQWDPKKAANDLIARLLRIRDALPRDEPHLVSIILDGENAWEHFKNDGRDFFLALYEGLSREERIRTTTISAYLGEVSKGEPLASLHPGSWINANFGIWLGHEEDNLAWDYLTETREQLETFQRKHPEKDLSEAWKSIYIAEGSDWNWWYGDEHSTDTQEEFDELFRHNLMQVYRAMGKDVPSHLYVPVLREDRAIVPALAMRGFIHPTIDGFVTSYYEWYEGAELDVRKSGGSMHKSESLIAKIFYGFDKDKLYLRVDTSVPFADLEDGTLLSVTVTSPSQIRVSVSAKSGTTEARFCERLGERWVKTKEIREVAVRDIFEISIAFADLNAKEKDEINLFVSLTREEEELESCPWRGFITITVPSPDFEAMMWQ